MKPSGLRVGLIALAGVLFLTFLVGGAVLLAWPGRSRSPATELASNGGPNTFPMPVEPPPPPIVEPRNLDAILNPTNQNPPVNPFPPPNVPRPNPFPNPPGNPFANPKAPIPVAELPRGGNIVVKPLFPAPADDTVKPADFAGNTLEVTAPHPISKVIAAGSGRYLLLHHEPEQKVSVLDVPAARVTRTISLGQAGTMIAGGHDFFVAYLPGTNEFQRFSLKTLEADRKTASAVVGEIKTIGMGAASNGPVIICVKDVPKLRNESSPVQFLDPNEMKPGRYPFGGQRIVFPLGQFNRPIALQVSGNGGVFTAWTTEFPSGVYSYVFGETGQAIRHFENVGPRTLFPSGDGRTLFSDNRIYGPDMKPLTAPVGGHNHKIWYLPAVTGPEYLMIEEQNQGFAKSTLAFEMRNTTDKSTARIPQADGTDGLVDWLRGTWVPLDQRFFLIPAAKTLAVRPIKNPNAIILCKIR